MNIFDRVTAGESKQDHGQDLSVSAAFAEARLSSPPAANAGDRNSSSMPGGIPPAPELMADLQGTGVIKLPRGPVDQGATFHERVAKPGNGGGSSGTYDDTDANAYRSLDASADVPTPPVQRPSDREMREALKRMLNPDPTKGFTERLVDNIQGT